MAALSEYSNVYNTALLILVDKGYRVWYEKKTELYCAEKGGWDFKSDSPCGLLGVVAIFEYKDPKEYSEYWWKVSGQDLYSNLEQSPPEYQPIWQKRVSPKKTSGSG